MDNDDYDIDYDDDDDDDIEYDYNDNDIYVDDINLDMDDNLDDDDDYEYAIDERSSDFDESAPNNKDSNNIGNEAILPSIMKNRQQRRDDTKNKKKIKLPRKGFG